jgi:bacteriocin-like protein
MSKKNEKAQKNPLRVLDTKQLNAVVGGLNFTKITY